jgi:hypothetical protein
MEITTEPTKEACIELLDVVLRGLWCPKFRYASEEMDALPRFSRAFDPSRVLFDEGPRAGRVLAGVFEGAVVQNFVPWHYAHRRYELLLSEMRSVERLISLIKARRAEQLVDFAKALDAALPDEFLEADNNCYVICLKNSALRELPERNGTHDDRIRVYIDLTWVPVRARLDGNKVTVEELPIRPSDRCDVGLYDQIED